MIHENTVLILGAGASMPYDYPSGLSLKKTICNNLSGSGEDPVRYDIGTHPTQVLAKTGLVVSEIRNFREALFFSGRQSVDEFLEHRTEFMTIGKRAIAQALIPHEGTENLFNRNESVNWYNYLFTKMNTSFEDFDTNRISFITFNYDRSLEEYLFTALKNSYGKSNSEVKEKMLKIKIIHLHGQLDYLPWQKENGREYSSKVTAEVIQESAESIKIIHEDIENDKEFNEAHAILRQCTNIFFLGFGFHPTNLRRLRIEKRNDLQLIAGTSKGLTDNERRHIKDTTQELIQWEHLIDTDIVDFFRGHFMLK